MNIGFNFTPSFSKRSIHWINTNVLKYFLLNVLNRSFRLVFTKSLLTLLPFPKLWSEMSFIDVQLFECIKCNFSFFQFENFGLKSSSNSSSKVIQHSETLSEKFVTKPFFARFVYGKLQDLFVSNEKEGNPALENIQRGVVSLFQVRKIFQ